MGTSRKNPTFTKTAPRCGKGDRKKTLISDPRRALGILEHLRRRMSGGIRRLAHPPQPELKKRFLCLLSAFRSGWHSSKLSCCSIPPRSRRLRWGFGSSECSCCAHDRRRSDAKCYCAIPFEFGIIAILSRCWSGNLPRIARPILWSAMSRVQHVKDKEK